MYQERKEAEEKARLDSLREQQKQQQYHAYFATSVHNTVNVNESSSLTQSIQCSNAPPNKSQYQPMESPPHAHKQQLGSTNVNENMRNKDYTKKDTYVSINTAREYRKNDVYSGESTENSTSNSNLDYDTSQITTNQSQAKSTLNKKHRQNGQFSPERRTKHVSSKYRKRYSSEDSSSSDTSTSSHSRRHKRSHRKRKHSHTHLHSSTRYSSSSHSDSNSNSFSTQNSNLRRRRKHPALNNDTNFYLSPANAQPFYSVSYPSQVSPELYLSPLNASSGLPRNPQTMRLPPLRSGMQIPAPNINLPQDENLRKLRFAQALPASLYHKRDMQKKELSILEDAISRLSRILSDSEYFQQYKYLAHRNARPSHPLVTQHLDSGMPGDIIGFDVPKMLPPRRTMNNQYDKISQFQKVPSQQDPLPNSLASNPNTKTVPTQLTVPESVPLQSSTIFTVWPVVTPLPGLHRKPLQGNVPQPKNKSMPSNRQHPFAHLLKPSSENTPLPSPQHVSTTLPQNKTALSSSFNSVNSSSIPTPQIPHSPTDKSEDKEDSSIARPFTTSPTNSTRLNSKPNNSQNESSEQKEVQNTDSSTQQPPEDAKSSISNEPNNNTQASADADTSDTIDIVSSIKAVDYFSEQEITQSHYEAQINSSNVSLSTESSSISESGSSTDNSEIQSMENLPKENSSSTAY